NGPVTKNGLYQLHGTSEKPEWVLNSGQMTNFIKNLTSKFSSNFTVPTPASSVSGGCGDISVEINIGGNADASTVDALKKESTGIIGEIK
ncbi:hypothetical protein OEK97_28035, partial [Escherichia coli]|uniref:hypothetical protein n=1 Tax=Escherichia coli TaxID=562 RepID=UPI0021D8BE05